MRDIIWLNTRKANSHRHISTEKAIRLVREAKAKGNHVTAEVTPHHLH
jgi:dihydroorotase